jgi:hypothetical protein
LGAGFVYNLNLAYNVQAGKGEVTWEQLDVGGRIVSEEHIV